jgi:hypothetical protein
MSQLFYHVHPETLTLETKVVNANAGPVMLAESPFFPGSGVNCRTRAPFAEMEAKLPSSASSHMGGGSG